jgi:hypothetical protein
MVKGLAVKAAQQDFQQLVVKAAIVLWAASHRLGSISAMLWKALVIISEGVYRFVRKSIL